MSMNPEIKDEWIKALRSGDYVKGTGQLHGVETDLDTGKVTHTFCCLGVLCELAVAAGVTDRALIGTEESGNYRYFKKDGDAYDMDADVSFLPPSVQAWSGLNTHNPRVPHVLDEGTAFERQGSERVSDLNDNTYDTFEPIAALIESTDL